MSRNTSLIVSGPSIYHEQSEPQLSTMSNAQRHPKVAPRTHTNFICNIQKAWNRQNHSFETRSNPAGRPGPGTSPGLSKTRGWKEAKQSNTWTPYCEIEHGEQKTMLCNPNSNPCNWHLQINHKVCF
jgi:hypothetical protein